MAALSSGMCFYVHSVVNVMVRNCGVLRTPAGARDRGACQGTLARMGGGGGKTGLFFSHRRSIDLDELVIQMHRKLFFSHYDTFKVQKKYFVFYPKTHYTWISPLISHKISCPSRAGDAS